MKKELFKKALKESLTIIEDADCVSSFIPIKKKNPSLWRICNLVNSDAGVKCFKCPLNVMASKENDVFGCMQKIDKSNGLTRYKLFPKVMYEIALKEIDNHPLSEKAFHSETKSSWAYALRAAQRIVEDFKVITKKSIKNDSNL